MKITKTIFPNIIEKEPIIEGRMITETILGANIILQEKMGFSDSNCNIFISEFSLLTSIKLFLYFVGFLVEEPVTKTRKNSKSINIRNREVSGTDF